VCFVVLCAAVDQGGYEFGHSLREVDQVGLDQEAERVFEQVAERVFEWVAEQVSEWVAESVLEQ
jgi:hypothetical protein